ncbi:UrcA family protein [Sphingomicrobium nitratireducens]|uniref:UrcA family protein n=1 Tax=Sphingomicrobium nitratireducens TaxID=2964666 RepID=UPI00223F528E|nr:UrcA family protein [Sphingomicrobium nitratireducens]
MKKTLTMLAGASLLISGNAMAMQADPVIVEGESAPIVEVSYADLDLTEASDFSALKGRVANAIEIVCSSADHQSVREGGFDQCRSDATADAKRQLQFARMQDKLSKYAGLAIGGGQLRTITFVTE